jgi:hypothetical protein
MGGIHVLQTALVYDWTEQHTNCENLHIRVLNNDFLHFGPFYGYFNGQPGT